jgi:glycosyltransferase involved in cell wall biosynthesis
MYSLVVPIYKNEANIPPLVEAVKSMRDRLDRPLEVVFVVDGSPDNSVLALREQLSVLKGSFQLICLSRNFGSFSAIGTGLKACRGDYFVVMAADLQEPPQLALQMFAALKDDECDVALGERTGRDDPLLTKLSSNVFWWLYRRIVFKELPPGGVDIFGCNKKVRDQLTAFTESKSSLVGQLIWIGFRRKLFPYERLARTIGKSSWTFTKKWNYLLDSIYSFSDLPIILLVRAGLIGLLFSILFGGIVLVGALSHRISVPGYAATVLVIIFFGMLNLLALGLIGIYISRAFENTKARPTAISSSHEIYEDGKISTLLK